MIDADPIHQTFGAFYKHAGECSECDPLCRHVCKYPEKPPYALVQGCCERGQELVEAWIIACQGAIEAYRDRHRS